MGFEAWIALFFLASLIGFFADRTNICTVKAIEEILTTRRAYMLLSFGKTVLWVTGVMIWLAFLFDVVAPDGMRFGITWPSLFGGMLFGVGAVFNGGCAIATLRRLGSGELGMVITLLGFALGVAAYELLKPLSGNTGYVQAEPWLELGFGFTATIGILVTVWAVWEVVRLWRSASARGWWARWRAPRFRLSTGAAIIGLSNGVLYGLLGTWAYTHTLRRGVEQVVTESPAGSELVSATMLWWLFLALVVGAISSAVVSRRFALAWRPTSAWLGFFGGGLLMGLGAALVPGGNDVIVLNSIPSMSPHAIPAYVSMLVGVVVGLYVVKLLGGAWERIDCSGDVCRVLSEAKDS